MSSLFIYAIIIVAIVMIVVGFIASANEFKKMDEEPEEYRHRWPFIEGSPKEQREKNYNQS